MRLFGRILALVGILVVLGLVAGLAYSAGLSAAGVAPGAAAPAVGYPAYGWPWWGFGFGFGFFHLFGVILFFLLVFGLLRLAFGGFGGRRHGYEPGWGRGGRGWDHGPGEGESTSSDPRETWIRERLDDWHRSAHAQPSPGSTAPPDAPSGPDAGPDEPSPGG